MEWVYAVIGLVVGVLLGFGAGATWAGTRRGESAAPAYTPVPPVPSAAPPPEPPARPAPQAAQATPAPPPPAATPQASGEPVSGPAIRPPLADVRRGAAPAVEDDFATRARPEGAPAPQEEFATRARPAAHEPPVEAAPPPASLEDESFATRARPAPATPPAPDPIPARGAPAGEGDPYSTRARPSEPAPPETPEAADDDVYSTRARPADASLPSSPPAEAGADEGDPFSTKARPAAPVPQSPAAPGQSAEGADEGDPYSTRSRPAEAVPAGEVPPADIDSFAEGDPYSTRARGTDEAGAPLPDARDETSSTPAPADAADGFEDEPAEPAAAVEARLVVLSGLHQGEVFPLAEVTTIGREPGNDILLDRDPAVSRRHAEIRREGNEFVLRDLNSSNGCFVNEQRVTSQVLQPGEPLRIGRTEMRLDVDS